MAAMKSDLRNLVTAEEAFFADSVAYSTDTAKVHFKVSTGVTGPTITTGAGFWTATVGHSQITGAKCEIAVNTANTLVTTAGDGEPVCFKP